MSQASVTAVKEFTELEKRFEARGGSTAVPAALGRGRVVNWASDTALWGAGFLADAASKGAVNAIATLLTRVEASEYVPQAWHGHDPPRRAAQCPQIPEDLNAVALFLLTQGSGFITGQLPPVNGGFVMH